jgi:predicted nucleotidyltransferase
MPDPWVERYKQEVLPKLIAVLKPRRILLFGSRASGNARPDSDLDVIIVSETFAGIPFVKRMAYVLSIARFPKHVDYLCYTREEFDRIKDTSSVVQSALEEHAELAVPA